MKESVLQVVIDTFHIVVRTIVFVIIIMYEPKEAINAFSIAQMVSTLVHIGSYAAFFSWYIRKLKIARACHSDTKLVVPPLFADMDDFKFESAWDFLPGMIKNKGAALDARLCVLTGSFVRQCAVKQVLTEGERYVMSVLPLMTFAQQATYDIVNNLGSMAARFVFRPIEDGAYFYFTQTLVRGDEVKADGAVGEAAIVLRRLLRLVSSVGLVVLVFGQAYSGVLLRLYGGAALTTDSLPAHLLRCHCLAVLLLAVNGVTEAYAFATMPAAAIDAYNRLLVLFSAGFLLASAALVWPLGPAGFVAANCLNMTARITHSLRVIARKHAHTSKSVNPLHGLLPTPYFTATLALSALITLLSEQHVYQHSLLLHIALGSACLLITLAAWAIDNRELVYIAIHHLRPNTSLKTD